MADSKISNLPAGTEPLTGTEQIAIVQSGTTKMVDVDAVATTNNFATKDLTFTGNRSHDTNGNTFYLQTETTGANKSYIYTDLTDALIGFDTNSVGVTALATTLNWNSVSRVTVKEFETVINDSPDGDFNFRVEGLTDTNLIFTDASADFVGIGTVTPQAKLDIHAQGSLDSDVVFNVRNSLDTSDMFTVLGNGEVYSNISGVSNSTSYGLNAGKSNTAANQSAFGFNSGLNNTGISQSAFGYNSGKDNTGTNQTAFGNSSGLSNTGISQSSFGNNSGKNNTGDYQAAFGNATGSGNTGSSQSAFGFNSGKDNTGNYQAAFGTYSGDGNTGNYQSAFGYASGYLNTGANNCNFGYQAGRFITGGATANTTSSNSIYIGANTLSSAVTTTNEIVIGDSVLGNGDNTVTIGNSSITDNYLNGDLHLTNGNFINLPCEFQLAVSDETTDLTTGTAKITFRMPYGMTLTDIRASVTTAPTGSVITVDVNESATTILSTKLTIDATEKTSTTAATPVVISDTALADDAEITIDIDTIGSTIAGAGLKVTLIGTRA